MVHSTKSKIFYSQKLFSVPKRWPYFIRQMGVLLLLIGLSLSPVLAQNKTWTGSGGTNWNTPDSWTPSGVPTATDNVTIVTAGNQPIIGAGIAAVANSVEIRGGASLSIASTGSLTVVASKPINATFTAAFYNMGTVNNSGQLVISHAASKNFGVINESTFNNNATSELNIDNAGSIGFWNRNVSATPALTNAGKIILGATTTAGTAGLYNQGTVQNNGGQIIIDRAGAASIQNLANSSIVSSGTITIGKIASSGLGIYNFGTFRNLTGALFDINQTNTAIYNLTQNPFNISENSPASEFTNAGKIVIGQLTSVGGLGIHNLSGGTGVVTFVNSAGAEIIIDRTSTAIQHENMSSSSTPSSFTNAGKISIGQTANVSGLGIYNLTKSNSPVTFINTAGAEISIDRINSTGIQNENTSAATSSFTNAGKISIGQLASVNSIGIYNVSSGTSVAVATFINTTGAEITIDRANEGLQNSKNTIFDNAGSIKIGTTAPQ